MIAADRFLKNNDMREIWVSGIQVIVPFLEIISLGRGHLTKVIVFR